MLQNVNISQISNLIPKLISFHGMNKSVEISSGYEIYIPGYGYAYTRSVMIVMIIRKNEENEERHTDYFYNESGTV